MMVVTMVVMVRGRRMVTTVLVVVMLHWYPVLCTICGSIETRKPLYYKECIAPLL